MSLYNALFGVNPFAELLLATLKLSPDAVGRFRDVHLTEDGKRIVVFTRNGGGNREEYQDVIAQLQAHPLYVRDWDDDFDCTYASFEFKVPEEHKDFADFLHGLTQDKRPPMQKFDELLTKMKENPEHPEVQRTMKKMAPVLEQLRKALEDAK
jgi:hypothetical protein